LDEEAFGEYRVRIAEGKMDKCHRCGVASPRHSNEFKLLKPKGRKINWVTLGGLAAANALLIPLTGRGVGITGGLTSESLDVLTLDLRLCDQCEDVLSSSPSSDRYDIYATHPYYDVFSDAGFTIIDLGERTKSDPEDGLFYPGPST
jgi:hypothetical protein